MRQFLTRYRRSLIVIVVLIVAFAVLASRVMADGMHWLDHWLLRALRTTAGDPVGPTWLGKAMMNWSALGSGHVVTLIVIIASLALFLSKRPRHALLVIGCTIGTSIIVNSLKAIFERARPSIVEHIDQVTGFSFPSGHTTTATGFYATLGILVAAAVHERRVKIFVYVIAAVLPLLVGFTRVFLGVHYPTDVLGGWCVGLAWALALGILNDVLQRRGVVEDDRGETSQSADGNDAHPTG